MKPVVVLVGRPNVGKSTLFNRLTRSRAAIVADEPGVTRDRQYGDGLAGDRPYYVVDTGGISGAGGGGACAEAALRQLVASQVRQALVEADAIVLLVDAREGVQPLDREIANDLRRLGKPLTLAVNKAEGMEPATLVGEFYPLGLGEPRPISSGHGEGIADLMRQVLAPLPRVEEEAVASDLPRVAVIGRPNAGKSTLVNALLGEERVIVSDLPGTTRDAIDIPLERGRKRYVLVDTAGVRRRARVEDAVEKFSALKTLQAIDQANVVILVLDALAGVGEHDATLASYALKHGRALILALNKWDALDREGRVWVKRELERKLRFLDFAPVHYISALHKTGVGALFASVDKAFASATCDLPTPRLNKVLRAAVAATPPPIERGRRIRLKFAHQGGKNPPLVIVHGNQVRALSASYRRYLARCVRKAFHLVGTPVAVQVKEGANPYSDRRPRRRRRQR
ncbi:MAG TPA: ribosome biogenesis GTPase Der [Burkholderiales bacterium]|jgi:GTP-binding protein